MTYLITYDLHNRRVYTSLYQLLAAWKAIKLADSVWLVNLSCDAAQARDFIASKLDNDDSVAVVELAKGIDWATLRVPAAATAFLSAYVTPREKAA